LTEPPSVARLQAKTGKIAEKWEKIAENRAPALEKRSRKR
jgi:hypothetical protein